MSIYYMAAVTSGRMAVTEQQDKYIINNQCPNIIGAGLAPLAGVRC